MKKIYLVLIVLLYTNIVFSQKIYFGLQGGYNIDLSKQNTQMYFNGISDEERILFADYTYDANNTPLKINAVPINFGSAFTYGANIGFLYKNFGIELQANYFKTSKYTAKIADNFYSDMWLESLNFIPSFVFKSDTTKLSFIAKVGLILSSNTVYNYNYSPTEDNNYQTEQTGGLSFGAYFGIGAEYSIFKNFYLSFLIEGNILNFVPNKQKVVSYTYLGEDNLSQLTEEQRTINFKDEVNLTYDENNAEYVKPNYNLSNLGLKLSLKYYINL